MIPKDDEINELLSDIEGLHDEICDLEKLNADLEADRDDWKEIATDAKDELTEVRTDRDGWRKTAAIEAQRTFDATERAEKAEAELDELAKEKEQVELQRDDLRSELEYLYEVAESDSEDYYRAAGRIEELESAWFEEFVRGNVIQARANSWFEIAKIMTRARNWWVEIADTESDRADKAEVALEEYKTALRVLGGSKE